MQLSPLDIAVIVAFFAINLGIGLYFARGGGKSMSEFFLSGRSVPWWLAGTSMVATTFAVDTPLAVTGFVAQNGIAGNWLWWNMAASGILTVFFFAALWRRSGVLTDVEFIELRYGGKPAAALRGVRAVYQGVIVNTIIMGWVNLAMVKILSLTLHVPTMPALYLCLALTALYVTIGGFWSVLVTDVLQFIVKMTMAIVLAVAAVAAVGGIGALESKLARIDARQHVRAAARSILAFFPPGDASWMPLTTFLVFIGVAWWASSYPGAEPGGGSYIAQRIFASRSEKDAVIATLFFNVAHYALRPWPWILVALAALVLYPHGVTGADGKIDPELGYVQTLVDHLPASLRGLDDGRVPGRVHVDDRDAAQPRRVVPDQRSLPAFHQTGRERRALRRGLARDDGRRDDPRRGRHALHDVRRRSMEVHAHPDRGRGAGDDLALVLVADQRLERDLGAGGVRARRQLVLPERRRGRGRSERDREAAAHHRRCNDRRLDCGTLATKPESEETLMRFYDRVRPSGGGWRPIARLVPGGTEDKLGIALLDWVAGLGLVYGMLFGIGRLVLGELGQGLAWMALAAVCAAVIARTLRHRA